MAERVSAMRYAQAVYRIAEEENKLDKWLQDLKAITLQTADAQIKAFLQNPKVHFKDKRRILADKLGGMNPTVLKLVYLLITKGRLALLPDISEEYGILYDKHHGIEQAEVITAVPLSEQEELDLKRHLSEITGKQVVVKTKVDPGKISGMIVRVGDKLIDGCTRSKLSALKRELGEGGT